MRIVVHCSKTQQEEFSATGIPEYAEVTWVFEKAGLLAYKQADAILDLLFEYAPEHIQLLMQMNGLIIVNSVLHTLAETDAGWVRINGWTTFLNAPVVEASSLHGDLKKVAEAVFLRFNKKIEWLPDSLGFVVPRVVSMIVNEAHFALVEGVSTRAEIDTAMKLGTAYPFGPFEWSEKIGLKNIVGLLQKLSVQQPRYMPAPLMLQQAGAT